ncbi:MAG: hypothetical protein U9Q98_04055 [Bacteroidota bacterium]|nr:hypothetical protein [Bacteroidota bacterium]
MKKIIINIIIFIFLTTLSMYAQEERKKFRFNPSIGMSIPYSDFAKDNMEYDAGFSSVGLNINSDIMWYWGKYFGLSLDLGYTNLFFKKKAYKSEYERILEQSDGIEVLAGNYQVAHSSLGLIIKTPEFYNTEVLTIGRLGFSYCIHPEILVTDEYWGVINSIKQDDAISIISSLNFRINHYISEKYGISIYFNTYSTNPRFSDKTSIENGFNLYIAYYSINAGFIIRF